MMNHVKKISNLIFIFLILLLPLAVNAQLLESDSFKVLDPVLDSGGEYMTSSNFRLLGSISQISIGTSSATSFNVSGGFLYFPFATIPTATATAGDGQVDLTWTISIGFVGWKVSNYNIGQATVSGGPYAYTSAGSTTAATAAGLSNGTQYFFVVRPEDAFGRSLATSTEVSATPVAAPAEEEEPAPAPGGGPILSLLEQFLRPKPPVVIIPPEACPFPQPDLNCDGRIDLQDLSIFLFLTPGPIPNQADFNDDGNVNLRDLSVLFFSWTDRLLAFGPDERRIAFEDGAGEEAPRRGFFERFFGRDDDKPAQVIETEEEERDVEEKGVLAGIANFFLWIFISVMEVVIRVIGWIIR